MIKYVSVQEMVAIEQEANEKGHTYARMMAHAGKSLSEIMLIAYSHINKPKVLGLIGTGNNGGDGLVAMNHLLALGWECSAYLVKSRADDHLLGAFIEGGGVVHELDDDAGFAKLTQLVADCDILLDGLLGTGIKLPLREPIPAILEQIKFLLVELETCPAVVAVDCPSGVDCDSGEAATECISADLTVCMAAVKKGLLTLPAYSLLGELVVGDIGLPENLDALKKISREVLGDWTVDQKILPRPLDGHKGTFGKVLVVAGSRDYPGALIMAGKAAFRSGAGWVTLCAPAGLHPSLVPAFPEATWLPAPGNEWQFDQIAAEMIKESLGRVNSMLIGPGLGVALDTQAFLDELISLDLPPLILDADGLKLIANHREWWKRLPEMSILTPHPGEMSILTGLQVDEIQRDRVGVAEKYAAEWGHVLVLKGAFTVVADPLGHTAILPIATPALGRAGTGDVLAGMITGLRAQGLDSYDAACASVWLHAQAGLLAAEIGGSTAGVLAGDLIEVLPGLFPY